MEIKRHSERVGMNRIKEYCDLQKIEIGYSELVEVSSRGSLFYIFWWQEKLESEKESSSVMTSLHGTRMTLYKKYPSHLSVSLSLFFLSPFFGFLRVGARIGKQFKERSRRKRRGIWRNRTADEWKTEEVAKQGREEKDGDGEGGIVVVPVRHW